MNLLPNEHLESLRIEAEKFDAEREEIIIHSRGMQKDAKKAIYFLQQNDIQAATELLAAFRQKHTEHQKTYGISLEKVGAYGAALEEYVEAATFCAFILRETLPTAAELEVDGEIYVLGLSDLTGELARRAVFLAIDGKKEEVKDVYSFVSDLHGVLLEFHFRNSQLRKKFDSIKYNLQKIEQVLYETHIRS